MICSLEANQRFFLAKKGKNRVSGLTCCSLIDGLLIVNLRGGGRVFHASLGVSRTLAGRLQREDKTNYIPNLSYTFSNNYREKKNWRTVQLNLFQSSLIHARDYNKCCVRCTLIYETPGQLYACPDQNRGKRRKVEKINVKIILQFSVS